MENKVIIFGGAGFIGSNLAIKLKSKGYFVLIIDNLSKCNDSNINELKNHGIKIIEGNIGDNSLTERYISHKDVIYILSSPQMNDCNKKFENCYHTNIEGLFNLMESLNNKEVKKIIFASSTSIYANQFRMIKEGDLEKLSDNYTLSKKIGEIIVEYFCNKYNIEYCIFRNAPIYGPRQYVAEGGSGITFKLIQAVFWKKEIKIFAEGKQKMDLVFVSDLVNIYSKAINKGYGIYNVSKNSAIKLCKLAEIVENEVGKKMSKILIKEGEVYDRQFSNKRLISDFDYPKFIDENTGVKLFIDWFRRLLNNER